MNDIRTKMQHIVNFAKSLSVKDTELNIEEKIEALQKTLKKIEQLKDNAYLNTVHDKDKEKHQIEFITLLERIDRNHLTENNYYRYIIDLFEKKEEISVYLKMIRNDKNKFVYLSKKYNLVPSRKMKEVISFTDIISEAQITPLLFMFESDNINSIDTKDLKSIFSILFYGKKMQYSFYKKIDSLETKLENTNITFFEKALTDTYL